MKKYLSLGELLIDYRNLNKLSQADLAAKLDVDIRTVIRWEKDVTLIKPEKERDLVLQTFIPYQVIRNLNASVPIPTFYDFSFRKYSLAALGINLLSPEVHKQFMDAHTSRIRTIEKQSDIDDILRYTSFEYKTDIPLKPEVIQEAAKILPELNMILFDNSGYYAGHLVILPLKPEVYDKLRNRKITEEQIKPVDLMNFRNTEEPVFHEYDITADCNTNMLYIVGAALRFFRDQPLGDYVFSTITIRHDSEDFNTEIGLQVVWEDKEVQKRLGLDAPLRFYEGNFKAFFNN